jgi:hypothetical protein
MTKNKLRKETFQKYKRIQDLYSYLNEYKLENQAKEEIISALFSYDFNDNNSLTRILSYDCKDIVNPNCERDQTWADDYIHKNFRPKK